MMGRVEALVSYFKNNKKSKRRVHRNLKELKQSVAIKEVVHKIPSQSKPCSRKSKTLIQSRKIPGHKLIKKWKKSQI